MAADHHHVQPLTCIDLFCGCGGFTLGMLRAGFRVVAAVDIDAQATGTLKMNLGQKVEHVLTRDLTTYQPKELQGLLGQASADVIVGGPPCQGFSHARARDGSNHGTKRLVEDPRRLLYRDFLRFVEAFQPKVFVMENVPGIKSAAGKSDSSY